MTDAPQPPRGWLPPPQPSQQQPPPPPPPPPPTAPGWAAPPGGGYAPPAPPPPGATLPPPPGTPGYGYGYTPYAPGGAPKTLGGVSTALSILLVVTAIAAIAFGGALSSRASLLDDRPLDLAEVADADDLVTGTAGLYVLAFIATVVLWMVWQFRHAKNAEILGKRDGLGPGWAIGAWFIPIAGSLVMGPLQLQQSAKASDPDGQGRTPGVLVVWWVLWVLQGLISFGSGRFGFGSEATSNMDIDEFRSSDQLGSVGMFVTAAAAIVALVMIRTLTQRQRQAMANRGVAI